ncbi:MAG: MFS transporter [Verrucomicrobiales bacterium]|nr:MFS transporter [Verrucomicrobiales bacterium]
MSYASSSGVADGARRPGNTRQLSPFWMLFILTSLNLLNYLDRYVVSAVLTPIRDEFRVSDGELGRINTIFMIGYFLTSPLFGYLGDRSSRKWLIASGIFVWSLGTVLTGYATAFVWLLTYRVLVGVGEASYATISPGLISDVFPRERRNNALTIFYVAIPVGAALGNIIGGQVAAHFGWRNAFIWAGLPGLLLALVLLPFREPARGEAEGTQVEKPKALDVWKLFGLSNFNLVVWGYTAYTFALGAFGVWGPTFLHRIHGVPNELAATFFGAVLVVAGLVGTLVGGFAATAWQKRHPAGYAWVLSLSVLIAAPLAIAAFLASSKAISMGCLGAAMFFIFLCTGPVNTLIIESVPVNLRSSAMAVSIFLIHLFGDMWSSEIVGHLSDSWGSLQKAVMILPGALGVATLLWLALALKTKANVSS